MNILVAFIIALLISSIFVIGYGRGTNSVGAAVLFFIILFIAGVATQYWITPAGPELWGVSWVPVLFIVLMFAFLLTSPALYYRRSTKEDTSEAQAQGIGIFIWLLVIVLLAAAIAGTLRTIAAQPQI